MPSGETPRLVGMVVTAKVDPVVGGTAWRLKACMACGLVQRLGGVPAGHEARCARCGRVIRHREQPNTRSRVIALSLAALILYPVSMVMPVLEVSRMGH